MGARRFLILSSCFLEILLVVPKNSLVRKIKSAAAVYLYFIIFHSWNVHKQSCLTLCRFCRNSGIVRTETATIWKSFVKPPTWWWHPRRGRPSCGTTLNKMARQVSNHLEKALLFKLCIFGWVSAEAKFCDMTDWEIESPFSLLSIFAYSFASIYSYCSLTLHTHSLTHSLTVSLTWFTHYIHWELARCVGKSQAPHEWFPKRLKSSPNFPSVDCQCKTSDCTAVLCSYFRFWILNVFVILMSIL